MRQGWRVIFHSHKAAHTHTHTLSDTLPVTHMHQSPQLTANVAWTLRGIFSPLLISQPHYSHTLPTHTSAASHPPLNKARDDINRWTVLVLMHKSQQGGNITILNTGINMTEIVTAGERMIRMWFYLASNNLCRSIALKLFSPLMFFLSFFHNNTHLKTLSQLPPPH